MKFALFSWENATRLIICIGMRLIYRKIIRKERSTFLHIYLFFLLKLVFGSSPNSTLHTVSIKSFF
jgi:hypothetical protein